LSWPGGRVVRRWARRRSVWARNRCSVVLTESQTQSSPATGPPPPFFHPSIAPGAISLPLVRSFLDWFSCQMTAFTPVRVLLPERISMWGLLHTSSSLSTLPFASVSQVYTRLHKRHTVFGEINPVAKFLTLTWQINHKILRPLTTIIEMRLVCR
jgi:hypothetical protein